MLCICFICNYGYSALDVEPFKHTKTNKKFFYVKHTLKINQLIMYN